jgi:hypothetical protein
MTVGTEKTARAVQYRAIVQDLDSGRMQGGGDGFAFVALEGPPFEAEGHPASPGEFQNGMLSDTQKAPSSPGTPGAAAYQIQPPVA